jgi:FtsP/CotA-like multicopper oxidase with cupredoxin domain
MNRISRITLILVALTIAGVVASSLVLVGGVQASQRGSSPPPAVKLPAGCVRPAGGFLVIASEYGYNDSVLEGAGPTKAWPVITVTQGQTVNITVCNVDTTQSHGFQISNYFDGAIEAVGPGQVLHVPSFVASKAGTFQIYCAIFCTIHLFMEYGQLRVSS